MDKIQYEALKKAALKLYEGGKTLKEISFILSHYYECKNDEVIDIIESLPHQK